MQALKSAWLEPKPAVFRSSGGGGGGVDPKPQLFASPLLCWARGKEWNAEFLNSVEFKMKHCVNSVVVLILAVAGSAQQPIRAPSDRGSI